VTGDAKLETEGAAQDAKGKVQKGIGDAKGAIKDAVNCPEPTVDNPNEPLQVSGPTDVTSDVSPPVDEAFGYDIKTTEAQGKIIFVRNGNVVASFSFYSQVGADTSQLPDEMTVVNKGVAKLAS